MLPTAEATRATIPFRELRELPADDFPLGAEALRFEGEEDLFDELLDFWAGELVEAFPLSAVPLELAAEPDFFAAPDAVRPPAAPLFGVSFCADFEAAFAVLCFEVEPADLVADFEAPDLDVFEDEVLFAVPCLAPVADPELLFEDEAVLPSPFFFPDEPEPDFELVFFFDVVAAIAISNPYRFQSLK